MKHTVGQPDKNGISNMRSFHVRVTLNERISPVCPDIHHENETIQMMYVYISFIYRILNGISFIHY
jgi:hypothetical protein